MNTDLEISMTQGEANTKAVNLAYHGATGEAYQRTDFWGRIVEVADQPTSDGDWYRVATKRNGLRFA